MEDTILLGVEEVLTNLVTRYKTLSTDNSLSHNTLKEFDTELNDFINTYAKIKNLKASITAQELEIQLSEYKILIQDFQNRLNDGSIVGQNGTNGADGLSAYQVAVNNGFAGSQSQWLESLKGSNGLNGTNGADGQNGIDGKDFTYADFTPEQLALLKGEKGQDGTNGTNGIDGTHGLDGDDGLSAYQIALNNGFVGSEIEWLESLKGADGQNGIDGKDFTYADFTPEQLALLKGADGQNGLDGKDGVNGTNGKDFTFDMFTPTQLELIASLVTVDLTSILTRITDLETQIIALGGSVTPPAVEPTYFYGYDIVAPKVSFVVNPLDDSSTYTIESGFYKSLPYRRKIQTPYKIDSNVTTVDVVYLYDGKSSVDSIQNGFKAISSYGSNFSNYNYQLFKIENGVEIPLELIEDVNNVYGCDGGMTPTTHLFYVAEACYLGSDYTSLEDYFIYYRTTYTNTVTASNLLGENLNSVDSLVITEYLG